MSIRVSVALTLAAALIVAAGCARRVVAPVTDPPPEPEAVQQPADESYLPVADAFVSALERGEPVKAHELLTASARNTIPADEFASQLADFSAVSHNEVAHVGAEDAAYVLVSFDSPEAVAPEAITMPGMGMLLLRDGEDWAVAFFLPQSENDIGLIDLHLAPAEDGAWTISWIGANDQAQTLTLIPF